MPRAALRPWTAAAVAAALLSAGCSAVGPDYARPNVELPVQFRSAGAAGAPAAPGAAAAHPADPADPADGPWWTGFDDPQLVALVDEALRANRDLRVARLRIEELQARLQVSRALDKPQVGYGFTGNRTRRSLEQPDQFSLSADPQFNAFTLGLNLSWEIDLWGRVKRANEAALADLQASQAVQHGVMLSTVAGVVTGYVQLLGLDRERQAVEQTLKNRRDVLALIGTRQRGGSATQIQVENARADVEAVSAALPDLERRITAAENLLSLLAGRVPGPVARRSLDLLAMPAVPAGLPASLLARRPDVQAAEQQLAAASARIGVARAEYLPSVSITGALGLASDDLRWLLARTARAGEISRGAVGTLFSAGRIAGDVQAAEALRDQNVELYLKSVLVGLQEVDDALAWRGRAAEQGRALERQLQALQEALRLARLRFEGGQSTFLDVLDAEQRLIEAQSLRAQGRRDELVALVSVHKALGGGWMEQLEQQRLATLAAADPPRPAPAPPLSADAEGGPAAP